MFSDPSTSFASEMSRWPLLFPSETLSFESRELLISLEGFTSTNLQVLKEISEAFRIASLVVLGIIPIVPCVNGKYSVTEIRPQVKLVVSNSD